MTGQSRRHIPEDHPVRGLFRALTERGMEQANLRDLAAIQYIANLLTEFVPIENLYALSGTSGRPLHNLPEILAQAAAPMPAERRLECYRHAADAVLFNLGLFPANLTYGRRTVSPSFYALRGRHLYSLVANLEPSQSAPVFQTLSDQFQQCVGGLNWVERYINDPFYQYMLRQFSLP